MGVMRNKESRWAGSIMRNAYVRDPRIWTGMLAVIIILAMIGSWNAQRGDSAPSIVAGITNGYGIEQAASSTISAPMHSGAVFSALAKQSATPSSLSAVPAQRMVVEQASLSITLPDVRKAEALIGQMVAGDGGFVESSQEATGGGNALTAMMTVRVPEADFSTFLDHARTLGTVTDFSQTGQDVTQQYTGLLQQIAELRSEAAAYTRLYNKAQSMRDMLQIEQSLAQGNSQISDLSSQKHTLSRSVQLATVNVTLTTTTFSSSAPPPVVTAWNEFISALGQSALWVFTSVAWVLPWAILFILIVAAGRGWMYRKK